MSKLVKLKITLGYCFFFECVLIRLVASGSGSVRILDMQYASGGIRFVAAFIDWLVILMVSFIVGFFLGVVLRVTEPMVGNLANIGIGIGYWVFYQASAGQTIGKKAMKIKVVDMVGNKPTTMRFFLREIMGKIASAITLGIGYLMILLDAKKQGLHDKIAGTVVVRV